MVLTFSVAGHNLDHPALGDLAMGATRNHLFELGFKRRKAGDALFDFRSGYGRDGAGDDECATAAEVQVNLCWMTASRQSEPQARSTSLSSSTIGRSSRFLFPEPQRCQSQVF